MSVLARERTAARSPAVVAVWAAGLLLVSGLPMETAAAFSSGPAAAVAGVAGTACLLVLWRLASGPSRRVLPIFAAMSVFGWVSAIITMLPPVGSFLEDAPVAVAFLLVNGTKVFSVVPVALVARRYGWGAGDLLLRTGDPHAPVVPGRYVGVCAVLVALAN